jgi:quercetin dioxygenase-like cupin family protein
MEGKFVARRQGEGNAFWVLGGLYEVKASSAETNDGVTIMEMTIPEGMGPPPHTHPGAEAVYVLEGTLRYHIGGEIVEGGPGSFFYIPAGTIENFEPTSTVRILVIYAPGGGIDKFFSEIGEPARVREIPPPPETPPDLDRMVAAGERYGIVMQAPAGT